MYLILWQTQHGRVEANNPGLLMLAQFPALTADMAWNLYHNQRQVVSPFDVHATLLSLIHIHLRQGHPEQLPTSRGTPLWEKMPHNRTCKEANVPPLWCVPTLSVDTSAFVKQRSKLLLRVLFFIQQTRTC